MIFYAKDKTKAKINDLPVTEDELENLVKSTLMKF